MRSATPSAAYVQHSCLILCPPPYPTLPYPVNPRYDGLSLYARRSLRSVDFISDYLLAFGYPRFGLLYLRIQAVHGAPCTAATCGACLYNLKGYTGGFSAVSTTGGLATAKVPTWLQHT